MASISEDRSSGIFIVAPGTHPDQTDLAAIGFAAMLEKNGFKVVLCDKFKNSGWVRAATPFGLTVDFSVSPDPGVIRMMHAWPLDDGVGVTSARLREALDRANADSWWNNYALDRGNRAVNVSSYVTIGQSLGFGEAMVFLGRQLEAFFLEAEETGLAGFFDRSVPRRL